MLVSTEGSDDLARALKELLWMDQDAAATLTLAIEHLRGEDHQLILIRYRGDHQRHMVELCRSIRRAGAEPEGTEGEALGPFARAMTDAIGRGGDRAILEAVKKHAFQMRHEYLRRAESSGELSDLCRRAALDEERHGNWAEESLGEA